MKALETNRGVFIRFTQAEEREVARATFECLTEAPISSIKQIYYAKVQGKDLLAEQVHRLLDICNDCGIDFPKLSTRHQRGSLRDQQTGKEELGIFKNAEEVERWIISRGKVIAIWHEVWGAYRERLAEEFTEFANLYFLSVKSFRAHVDLVIARCEEAEKKRTAEIARHKAENPEWSRGEIAVYVDDYIPRAERIVADDYWVSFWMEQTRSRH